jgi:AcrR family transcriptional regulator
MSVPLPDRRTRRRELTRREILDAAWELARDQGLAGLTMRDLGARVGMRAQSLYSYFPSKHAIYDAMFAQGNREMLDRVGAVDAEDGARRDPETRLRRLAEIYLQFSAEDPVRHQLLNQRPIPGFQPSADSYQLAVEALAVTRAVLHDCGVTSPRALDVWTALTGGLAAQQNANEPGGTRWLRLADEATDMFLHHFRQGPGGQP